MRVAGRGSCLYLGQGFADLCIRISDRHAAPYGGSGSCIMHGSLRDMAIAWGRVLIYDASHVEGYHRS
jgi:hypothetical protein